jgi:L-amino acid N-acyltransferase YncA
MQHRPLLSASMVLDMTLLIRPSEPRDLPAIHAAYSHAVVHGTASWEIAPPDEAEMGRRREAVIAAGFPWLVAERAGAVLGYAYAGPYRPRAAYRATVEDSIYLHPDATGQGVGKALLAALLAECERLGFRQIVTVVGDGYGGSLASLKLHEALGFEVIGVARAVGFKHGRWLDQVLMQRALGEGDSSPSPFAG